jgi:hypothetical protein
VLEKAGTTLPVVFAVFPVVGEHAVERMVNEVIVEPLRLTLDTLKLEAEPFRDRSALGVQRDTHKPTDSNGCTHALVGVSLVRLKSPVELASVPEYEFMAPALLRREKRPRGFVKPGAAGVN